MDKAMINSLAGFRVLVVEDNESLAASMCECLESAGAFVCGTPATVEEALQHLHRDSSTIDAVVLDIKLRGELSYAFADRLIALGIPFVFTTGYPLQAIEPRHASRPTCLKPFSAVKLVEAVSAIRQGSCAT